MEQLKQHLNEISTYFSEGANWHRRSANEVRKLPNVRGWGRWHEVEAKQDFCAQLELEKLIGDYMKYAPAVNVNHIMRAFTYTINDMEAFKNHHKQWIDRENMFITALNSAIHESRAVNMEIYKKLCCIIEEVQNEAMRVEWVYNNETANGWNAHDLSVKSKWLHDYFECDYKGGKIDFNIG